MSQNPYRRRTTVQMLDGPKPLQAPSVHERVIVLSHRAPLRHERSPDGRLIVRRSASGVVTALEPVVRARSGTWVAHGSGNGDADVADDRGRAPLAATADYRLRYVSLADDELRGYYYGFANEGLWPLCHAVGVPPVFRPDDFMMYQAANAQFSLAVVEEAAADRAVVFVQDYHFALAPRMLRQRLRSSTIVAFWHIPWPRPKAFATCPKARQLLEGLLGGDVVGLQTDDDCLNFLGSVQCALDAEVDFLRHQVRYRGHTTMVQAYPVGVEWLNAAVRATPPRSICRERVCRNLNLPAGSRLAIGVDRLDYTKGINEKFLAVERLLESRPDLRAEFVFVQVAEPSRECLPAYRAARDRLVATSQRVNARFGTSSRMPIRLLERHHEPHEVYELYRAADVCYVNSLHDGMNLVAKEFVCARDDGHGVLVLSERAGAAQQLRAALLVNPRSAEQGADTLARALEMSTAEQAVRMRALRANVETYSASWWADRLLADATRDKKAADGVPHHAFASGSRTPHRIWRSLSIQ